MEAVFLVGYPLPPGKIPWDTPVVKIAFVGGTLHFIKYYTHGEIKMLRVNIC